MPQKDWSSLKHGANPYEVVIGKTKAADTGFGMFQDIITKLNEIVLTIRRLWRKKSALCRLQVFQMPSYKMGCERFAHHPEI